MPCYTAPWQWCDAAETECGYKLLASSAEHCSIQALLLPTTLCTQRTGEPASTCSVGTHRSLKKESKLCAIILMVPRVTLAFGLKTAVNLGTAINTPHLLIATSTTVVIFIFEPIPKVQAHNVKGQPPDRCDRRCAWNVGPPCAWMIHIRLPRPVYWLPLLILAIFADNESLSTCIVYPYLTLTRFLIRNPADHLCYTTPERCSKVAIHE